MLRINTSQRFPPVGDPYPMLQGRCTDTLEHGLEFNPHKQLSKVRHEAQFGVGENEAREVKLPVLHSKVSPGKRRPEFPVRQPGRPRRRSPLTLRVARDAENGHAGVTNERRSSRGAQRRRNQSARR